MARASMARVIGSVVACRASGGGWYSPLMAAASRAISERIPVADIVLEVRDARIPLSSKFEELRKYYSSPRRMVVLNKADLANQSQIKEWMRYFEQNNCISYAVNSQDKDHIQQLLNLIQARVRELRKTDNSFTTVVLLVGIPNVGKSALANSLHTIGRISAEEKGKLKNVIVSPHPGETKDITSLKIGSHPNIYVLDTPGVLPLEISDVEVYSKLFLTGAIKDGFVGVKKLARYFLSILNSSNEYEKWSKRPRKDLFRPVSEHETSGKKIRRNEADYRQDFILKAARQTLLDTILSFDGNKDNENDSMRLIESEIVALEKAFQIVIKPGEDGHDKVASELLNLYRSGRLGQYTLDSIQCDIMQSSLRNQNKGTKL